MQKIATTLSMLFCTTLGLAQAPKAASGPALSAPVSSNKTPAITVRSKTVSPSREVPDRYRGRIVTVGSGGGVVGKETTYALLDDGRLFSRRLGQPTYTYVGKQTSANTKRVFWSVEDRCAIKKTKYAKPGNVYRFVGWRKGGETYRVTWAPGDTVVPPNYEQVYKGFMGMLPKHEK